MGNFSGRNIIFDRNPKARINTKVNLMQNFDPSRRKFIKNAALAGMAASITPAELYGKNAPKTSSDSETDGFVFLFQGDSITDGKRGRNNDPNHIMGHGYAFSVASRIGADFSQKHLQFYNRGVSGNKVNDLQKRWQADTLELQPDVLSILVGINDVHALIVNWEGKTTLRPFKHIYAGLLNSTKAFNPEMLFVSGLGFVYQFGPLKSSGIVEKRNR